MQVVGRSLSGFSPCLIRASPEGHISFATQPEVSLRHPLLLSSRPLWPDPFIPVLDEVESLLHLISFAFGWAHPPILYFLLRMVQ
jgi:hypothetical protein